MGHPSSSRSAPIGARQNPTVDAGEAMALLVSKLLQETKQLRTQLHSKRELTILEFREARLEDSCEIRAKRLFVMSLVERQ